MKNKQKILFLFFLLYSITGFSQDYDILYYFKLLPVEVFDATSDGISKEEIMELASKGHTEIWELQQFSNKKLNVSYIDQKVTILLTEFLNSPLLIVQTNNAHATILKTWLFDKEYQTFTNKELFPKITVNDFLDKTVAFSDPEKYNGNINFYLDENDRIKAYLNTWMEPDFDDIEIKYDIFPEIKGDTFILTKIEKNK